MKIQNVVTTAKNRGDCDGKEKKERKERTARFDERANFPGSHEVSIEDLVRTMGRLTDAITGCTQSRDHSANAGAAKPEREKPGALDEMGLK
jgi:hypothetical protein